MIISENSQLGLRFRQQDTKVQFLRKMIIELGLDKGKLEALCNIANDALGNSNAEKYIVDEYIVDELKSEMKTQDDFNEIGALGKNAEIRLLIGNLMADDMNKNYPTFMDDDKSSYYFICDSVYQAAELIKVSTGFTGRTLKDIKLGLYTYLMGKHKMVRFFTGIGYIDGFYFDDERDIVFRWGIEMNSGDYYFKPSFQKEFTTIMQVLTFVELGDIEVIQLLKNRNNGGKKDKDKITNTSNNTVYVVDSSWNKIIIRTDGFAVRGHFRLQPYGESMKDRKLIWIDAFEKHGYTRRPKAEIVR